MPVRVGLTGGTGHLGALVLRRLLADPDVESVVSVARRAVPLGHPKLTHVRADLVSPQALRALRGVDVCYHLAFQLWGGGGRAAMRATNLGGTATVLDARPAAVVFASSAAVYGAWPDNPLPLGEGASPRPNPECPYARHKLVAERMCLSHARSVVVRIAAVLGPNADPAVRRSAAGYRLAVPAVSGVSQALQFLDESDAVAALLAAGRWVLTGEERAGHGPAAAAQPAVFNAAPADWLDAPDIARISGGRVLTLPRVAIERGSEVLRRLRVTPFGADRAALLNGPLALDPARAERTLGWKATVPSAAVLASALRRA